jgi:AcrR family transcriptional regulator
METNAPWRNVGLDRSEQHRLKRFAVLKAASRAFAQKGYFQTSLADIAKEFNLNKATLYHYFKSKEEILFEIHVHAIASITDGEPMQNEAHASGRERLEHFIDRYVTMLIDDFGACLVLTDLKPLEKKSHDQCVAGRRQIDNLLRTILREGIKDGSLATIDPKSTASFIFGALNWICHWYHVDGEITPDVLKRRAVDFVLRSVESRSTHAAVQPTF